MAVVLAIPLCPEIVDWPAGKDLQKQEREVGHENEYDGADDDLPCAKYTKIK